MIVGLCIDSVRNSLKDILKTLFVWKIMIWLLAMVVYISIFIYGFYQAGLWTPELLKDTIFYMLFSATVSMFKASKISEGKHFFLQMLKENLKLGIVFEFLIGQYPFPLWIELFIIPMAVLLAGMQGATRSDTKSGIVNKLIKFIWTIAGVIVICHVSYSFIQHIRDLLSIDTLRQILLVPNLTLIFIPFLYALSLRIVYEEQFVLLRFKLKNKKLQRFAERQAILKFKNDLTGLKRWVNRWNLSRPQTRGEIVATINDFKAQQQLEKAPPTVPPQLGWSPYWAKELLSDEKLRPTFYDPVYEGKWAARSGNLKLDKDWSGNGINYSVTGTKLVANELELRLTVYEPPKIGSLGITFREKALILYKVAVGSEPPLKLNSSLINLKKLKFKHGCYYITLEKSTWGNITEGYDLIFIISTTPQLQPII
ncbi:hypothetical protein ACFQZN_15810 [Mucilaginibacter boryungensis]|uniref:Uncharacterized protein n=2 Tax=Mucilaginibacter boryungensis TaxID=768480 RepID=A0ABR9XC18_9SPHI|nr:hypothetical protein [Mucilaginibacter boryungensis]MBE9664923.1 hypothetical protein [Mucilaginibacter boryungensis]